MDTITVLIRTPYNQSARSVLTIMIFIKIACIIILIPPINLIVPNTETPVIYGIKRLNKILKSQ